MAPKADFPAVMPFGIKIPRGKRVRLFKQSATGAATGLTDGQPKREKVWVPTDAFLPCMHQVSQIVAPWIVAGQGKGEFPEAFNQIGMHTV